jgi:transcriptional regulator with XRE-family HTH domain
MAESELFQGWLRAHLDERGITIAAVGKMLGLSRTTASRIVNGKRTASPAERAKIARGLGVEAFCGSASTPIAAVLQTDLVEVRREELEDLALAHARELAEVRAESEAEIARLHEKVARSENQAAARQLSQIYARWEAATVRQDADEQRKRADRLQAELSELRTWLPIAAVGAGLVGHALGKRSP